MKNHHHHLPPPPPEPSASTDVAAPNPTTEPPNSTTQKTNLPQCSSSSPNPTTEPPNSTTRKKTNPPQSSSSSTSSHSPSRIKRRFKVPVRTSLGSTKRSGPGRGSLGPVRGSLGHEDIDALALPLGMAVAAVIAQVLERNYADVDKISGDHLSVICSSAVKESLSYVFGDSFDGFGRNFEKSFRSTLQTLRFVNESSQASASEHAKSWTRERLPEIAPHSTSYKQEHSTCSSIDEICQEESVGLMSNVDIHSNILEDTDRVMHQQLTLHRFQSDQQLACVSSSTDIYNSEHNQSMISTFRKSVMEQSRSNDLKELELGLVQKRLQLEEKQLDVMSEANSLGRSKLSMSYSMASFKAGKFKTELEDTRCAELLRQFVDCLMFGLVLMLSCLAYGIYIFSFERITDATSACTPSKDYKSWWKPQVMTSLGSGMKLVWCYAQALGRITIATSVIIFAIMCLLTKRSASSNQTMPLTFIILVLGVGIGFVGIYCIDTLGGSGYYWLLHWEVLCFLHFLSIVFTKRFHGILYGPVTPFMQTNSSILSPYMLKRILYYTVMLLVLPLSCGLLPFASIGEWSDHFLGELGVKW